MATSMHARKKAGSDRLTHHLPETHLVLSSQNVGVFGSGAVGLAGAGAQLQIY